MKFETLDALTVHSIGGGWGLEIEDEGHTECVAVIRGTDIPKLALGDTSSVPVRWETSSKVRTRLLQYGDIVMEVSGGSAATGQHTGRALFVTLEILEKLGGRVIPASFCRLLRLDSEKIDPKYISYQIANMHLTEEIALFENQSTGISNFQFTRFLGSIYPLTNDLQTQSSIANFFDSIDRQIITLQQINSSLESIAKAIFQSWFVDFDPVRVKLDGGKPIGLDEATANLFPNTFQESELGHIPKGWEIRDLDKTADYLNGLALQKYPPGDGPTFPVIKIAQLRKGDVIGADRCGTELPKQFIVEDGDVLFSWSGSLEVELWCGGTGALNQHLFKVTSKEFPKWFYYLWTLHHLDEFRLIAASKATTMGHIQRSHITDAKVVVPPRILLDAMTHTMSPIIDQLIANKIQSRTLAVLRDTLLPKLMSGELSVENLQS